MIRVREFTDHAKEYDDILCLPYEKRQKSRLRAVLSSGAEVGLVLPRGTVLRGGDCLHSDDGKVIKVEAAPESISRVVSEDCMLLMRAAYHLGNRHVALQVTEQGLCYLRDDVLDKMVLQLGPAVVHEKAPFQPESGAYSGHGH